MDTKILVQLGWLGIIGVFGLIPIIEVLFNSNSRCSGGCYLHDNVFVFI